MRRSANFPFKSEKKIDFKAKSHCNHTASHFSFIFPSFRRYCFFDFHWLSIRLRNNSLGKLIWSRTISMVGKNKAYKNSVGWTVAIDVVLSFVHVVVHTTCNSTITIEKGREKNFSFLFRSLGSERPRIQLKKKETSLSVGFANHI